jgi:hypothetical protein
MKNTLKDLKLPIESNTVIVGDFSLPLTPIERSSRKKKSTKKS